MLLLLLLFGMPVVFPAQDLTKLTVAYSSRSIAPIDYFIGEQYGFFKAEGLDVRLVQIRANVAVIATLASEVDVLGSITTAISAAQRGAPIKVLAVTLHRPLFWLVARPEFKNFKMNVLASVLQEYPTIQNGVATTERTLKAQLKVMRAV